MFTFLSSFSVFSIFSGVKRSTHSLYPFCRQTSTASTWILSVAYPCVYQHCYLLSKVSVNSSLIISAIEGLLQSKPGLMCRNILHVHGPESIMTFRKQAAKIKLCKWCTGFITLRELNLISDEYVRYRKGVHIYSRLVVIGRPLTSTWAQYQGRKCFWDIYKGCMKVVMEHSQSSDVWNRSLANICKGRIAFEIAMGRISLRQKCKC